MTHAFHATIAELAGDVNRQITQVREAYAKLGALESTVHSDDGMVGVTVGARGQVRSIELNPRVYRRLSPAELADAIMEQISRATGAVSEQSRQLMEPLMPEGLPYEEVFGENATLDAFLPPPVEPE
ncbi:YbaB/EbfC family nucleoid-associated protein [Nonomuraea dietziae]|uniref:DNA-binding protein YbaB n=1 Tax=Nonomuraea dietziae TaxID=65515 RepID=A0A7W5V3R7_9ACTN|nr:YbaB/EbfC family nucleoid-associated protein [Nonomuraea dietziae]MBB3729991.1 DNA-binding protein YbaB [Nonomuraea dietziae]